MARFDRLEPRCYNPAPLKRSAVFQQTPLVIGRTAIWRATEDGGGDGPLC